MKRLKDTSFNKIIHYKKYKDLYDFSSIECRVALFVMAILDIIFIISMRQSDSDIMLPDYISYLDTIGMALIGFLGFIVTGLAILTGAISSTVVKKLQERNKIQALEKILLSFYLLGLVSATVIVMSFTFHFLSSLFYNSIWQISIVLLSLISYFVVFSIFYAVKLIGNCLELFYIISNMQIVNDIKESSVVKVDIKQKYNNYRIMALEKAILINNQISVDDYADEIKKMIELDDISEQEKLLCLEMHRKLFSNNIIDLCTKEKRELDINEYCKWRFYKLCRK